MTDKMLCKKLPHVHLLQPVTHLNEFDSDSSISFTQGAIRSFNYNPKATPPENLANSVILLGLQLIYGILRPFWKMLCYYYPVNKLRLTTF